MAKLTDEQIKDLKWVKENLELIQFEGDEEDRYLMIPLPKGGLWDLQEETLTEILEDALARGESDDIEEIELIVSHYKKYDEEVGF